MTKQKRKYQKPLELDLPFEEALERFAQTDPKEVTALTKLMTDDSAMDALMKAFEAAAFEIGDDEHCWLARDLMHLFEYTEWRNFRNVVAKAWTACKEASLADPARHFVALGGRAWHPDEVFVETNKNPQGGRPSEDVILSRYAAYLVAENADPSKTPVAFAQTYFATQTRRQELADEAADELTYDERRVLLRDKLIEHNKSLASTAKTAGVTNFPNFMGSGLKGLYGGLSQAQVVKKKGLAKGKSHLDHAGHEELAANYFKATQTEAKLKREGITKQSDANRAHKEVGAAIRKTIEELGGTMPEDLPAEEHIDKTRKRVESKEPKKLEKKG
jgi:DNA-damage-inducible protein D